MTNPLLTFTGKDVVAIYAAAYAVLWLALTVGGMGLWALAHFKLWR